jgi:hypothetical protein
MKGSEDRSWLLARRLTRRRALRGALLGSAGLAGIAIIGCGGGEEEAPQLTAGPEGTPTESPAVTILTPEPGVAQQGWLQLEPSGELPSPRRDHSLVWDDTDEQVYLFGGRSADTPLNDLWALNVDDPAWSQVRPDGLLPAARFGHNAVFDPQGGRMLIFGGQAGDAFLNDLWAFTSQDNTWAEITPAGPAPAPRQGAGAALDTEGGRLYVTHGLTTDGYLDDTWALDLTAGVWEELSPPSGRPSKRCFVRAAWDPPSGRLLLFGGETEGQPFLDDLWAFDPATRAWQEPPPQGRWPPGRSQYGLVYVTERGWMLIFGGVTEGGNLRDLWFYVSDVEGWGYITTLGYDPGGRKGHDLALVPDRHSAILFGGVRGEREMQETWEIGLGRPEEE